MYRAVPIAVFTSALLAVGALAEDPTAYDIVVVPSSETPGDGKTETRLIDRRRKPLDSDADFDLPRHLRAKSTYWVAAHIQGLPPEASIAVPAAELRLRRSLRGRSRPAIPPSAGPATVFQGTESLGSSKNSSAPACPPGST